MVEKKQGSESAPVEGAGASQSAAPLTGKPPQGPLAQGQRWSVARKREVVMRRSDGLPVAALMKLLPIALVGLLAACQLQRGPSNVDLTASDGCFGDIIEISGVNFSPSAAIRLTISQTDKPPYHELGKTMADPAGKFSFTFELREIFGDLSLSAATGYTIRAEYRNGYVSAFKVICPGAHQPRS